MSKERSFLVINAIPNPGNMKGFKLYLSKIVPLFIANGGVKLDRYKTIEQVVGNSGVKMFGVFEFPNAQVIKDLIADDEFNSLSELRGAAFKQLDLFICVNF